MATPFFQIFFGAGDDEVDITANIDPSNVSLTITESDGESADTAEIVLDDKDGVITVPDDGSKIRIIGGYEDDFRDFGMFIIDNTRLAGWPQLMTVSGQGQDVTSQQKEPRNAGYPQKTYPTYGDIFNELAQRCGLIAAVSAEFASVVNAFEAQSGEDDLSFATRLADKMGAMAAPKNGYLVIIPKGQGMSASGLILPTIAITCPGNLMGYSYSRHGKAKFGSVTANWMDRKAGALKQVTYHSGRSGPDHLIRHAHQDEAEATRAARSRAKKLARSEASASFTIDGNPHATAGAHAVVTGARDMVDGVWLAKTVTHVWPGNASYVNEIQCELPGID